MRIDHVALWITDIERCKRFAATIMACLLAGCATGIPGTAFPREESHAVSPHEGAFSRALVNGEANPKKSAFRMLSVGLDGLGRPEGYVARQLDGWVRRWHAAQGGPEADESAARMAPVLDWLGSHLPASRAVALLHNDYRLDNCLLDTADPGHIVAVMDWDMCTQGDPLADLGYVLNYWVEPGDNPEWREIAAMPTWRDGFPSRAEAIDRYAARTGFDVAAIGWHQVFAAFKLAVIIQQIYIRFVRGQTQDQRFRLYWRRVLGLAAKARLLAGLSSHA